MKAIYGVARTSKEGQEGRGMEKRKGGNEKRNGGKEKRKGGKKREEKGRKKMKKRKEVAYASRGRVLLLLGMPLSWGHSMAMELSPNIRDGLKKFGTNCVDFWVLLVPEKSSFGAG